MQRNKFLGVLVGLLLIIALSVGIIMFYTPIYNNTISKQDQSKQMLKMQEEQFIEANKEFFMKEIYKSNFVLLMDVLRFSDKSYMKASDIFLPEEVKSNVSGIERDDPSNVMNAEELYDFNIDDPFNNQVIYGSEMDVYNEEQDYFNHFNQMIYNWSENFYTNTIRTYPSFLYYVLNQGTGKEITNSVEELDQLLEQQSSRGLELKDDLKFFMILKTDSKGRLSVVDYKGLDKTYIDMLLSMHLVNDVLQEESYYVQVNGSYMETHQFKNMVQLPANLTLIYASNASDFYNNGRFIMIITWISHRLS